MGNSWSLFSTRSQNYIETFGNPHPQNKMLNLTDARLTISNSLTNVYKFEPISTNKSKI